MDLHDLWHVVLLGAALLAAGGISILLLAPLVFDSPPAGLIKARPLVLVVVGIAGLVLLSEWLLVHGGSL